MATGASVALVLLFTAACGTEAAAPVTVATTLPSSTTSASAPPTTAVVEDAAVDGAAGALTTIGTSAAVTSTAARVPIPTSPSTECERIATAIAERHGVRTQQVIVRGDAWTDTEVTLEVATQGSGGWRCGAAMDARVGRTGMRPLLERRSGDGTTPAGVFPLATMTAHDGQRFSFFGNAPDPGVTAGTYRRVEPGDCFGATPNTAGYGHLRYDTSCPGPDDEYLPRFVNAYTNAALIGANTEPDVSGDAPGEIPYAAAIFLHRHVYVNGGTTGATKPTSGCVSLAQADLTTVLVGMTPDTVFAIGTTDWLLSSA